MRALAIRLAAGWRTLGGAVMKLGAGACVVLWLSAPASGLDKVTLGLNWLPDPEAGGFYQAQADGTYAKYGLDVTIRPGGPQANGSLFLILGKIEFYVGGDLVGDFMTANKELPNIVVAAEFQKDPQAFMSHPGVGLDRWTDCQTPLPS
jgi:NitT/TauT family transport system substrate-binding protein